MYGMLVVALADPAAAMAGSRFRQPGWGVAGGRKTIAGSLAFLLVATALGLGMAYWRGSPDPLAMVLSAVVTAAVLAGVEGYLGRGFDNLVLPGLAALLGRYCLML
jgi:dolichol kinase